MKLFHSVFQTLAVLALVLLNTTALGATLPRLDPSVHRTLRSQGRVNVVVTLRVDTSSVLSSITSALFDSRAGLISSLVSQLRSLAEDSQSILETILQQAPTSTSGEPVVMESRKLWLSNQWLLRGATSELIAQLSLLTEVLEIVEELVSPLPELLWPDHTDSNKTDATPEWGLSRMEVPSVWARGVTGKRVVIGSIDTGVRHTHDAIQHNFRGATAYGWFDAEKQAPLPYDVTGHGTYTMGAIAGANGIGVAPDVTWMTCKACRVDGCYYGDLLICMQFMLCPTDPSGNHEDCSKAPDIVSNSWNGPRGMLGAYKSGVNAWRAAGIIPIFSAGNYGPTCSSIVSPAEFDNVIGVGATDHEDALAPYSARGPASDGRIKPDLSAPGTNVRSASGTCDSTYATSSGTSISQPYVAGVVALLKSASPTLTFEQVRHLVTTTADHAGLVPTAVSCGNTPDGVFPNNMYGHGRVNALRAYNASQLGLPQDAGGDENGLVSGLAAPLLEPVSTVLKTVHSAVTRLFGRKPQAF